MGPEASRSGKQGESSVAKPAGARRKREREGPNAQLHTGRAAVFFHVAQGGKGNSLAQLNASFVFIKRMGMLVLAVRQDA